MAWQKEAPFQERFFAIVLQEDTYALVIPEQLGAATSLTYRPPENSIAEFHSHGVLDAFFSHTDDRDEQGFRIYGVTGQLPSTKPRLALRLGIYGTFARLPWGLVFETPTNKVRQARLPSDQTASLQEK